MYEKPSVSNKVFLIRRLVNTKMKEGVFVADHLNEFNSILSRLMSVDIKFDDEEDIRRVLELFVKCKRQRQGQKARRRTKAEQMYIKIKEEMSVQEKAGYHVLKLQPEMPLSESACSQDKEVHMVVKDYDDALVCCVENTVEDRIMNSCASFYATICKEELEKFRLHSGKNLKDVRYIPGLKKRLISVGQLDEKGYLVGFRDQQWKVTKRSLVVARENKRRSMYMVEIPSDGINATIDGRGNAAPWYQRLGHMSEKGMKILASKGRPPDLQKAVVGFCEPCVLGETEESKLRKV
nr:retrovirus-related Pol polyprotein from transposon TNT 1-94 [Tanacetum cinerariifolium]